MLVRLIAHLNGGSCRLPVSSALKAVRGALKELSRPKPPGPDQPR